MEQNCFSSDCDSDQMEYKVEFNKKYKLLRIIQQKYFVLLVLWRLRDPRQYDWCLLDQELPLESESPLSPGSGIHASRVDRASIAQALVTGGS